MNQSKNTLDSQSFWPLYGLNPLRIESYNGGEPSAEPLFNLTDGENPGDMLVATIFGDPDVDDPEKRYRLARTAAKLFASAMDMFELLMAIHILRKTDWNAPAHFDQLLRDVGKVVRRILYA